VSRWLLRRSVEALITACVAVVILNLLLHLLPGDPVAAILQDFPTDAATEAAVRLRFGADVPIATAIGDFLRGVTRGDLGFSLSEQRAVSTVLAERLGPTILLGTLTLLIDFSIGLALGVWSALHPGTWRARVLGALTLIGYALPAFVIGMVLVWIFGVRLAWLPTGGISDQLLPLDATEGAILLDRLQHLLLPLATMVIATIAVPFRQQRAAALATATQPWVLAARARGVSPGVIAWRHCWRPALTPIVTLFGLWLPMVVAGAVFVEALFNWPGVGLLITQATLTRDIPLVMGAGLLLIVMVQFGSLLADVLYRVVNPAQRSQ
jgi:peptide/nickel transport system permease protein